MTPDRSSLFGFRLAPAASACAPAAASALSAKVGGPEPTPLRGSRDGSLTLGSQPLVPHAESQGA